MQPAKALNQQFISVGTCLLHPSQMPNATHCQEQRVMAEFHQGLYLIPPEEISTGGVTSEMARRWQVLQNLQVNRSKNFRKICEHGEGNDFVQVQNNLQSLASQR